MKIQCDVCDKDEASVFCVADEAALCSACDHRVHHANKLAGKHQRFTLQNPSAKQVPLCDICHEKRAFLFCQQDRAILCRDCDGPIHKANEHTQKHNRFLLTGVKLSPTSTLYSNESSPPTSNISDNVPNVKSKSKSLLVGGTPSAAKSTTGQSATTLQVGGVPDNKSSITGDEFGDGLISQSSISEYLIETLPGWHVEDFLDSSFPSPYGLCQSGEGGNDLQQPFWDGGDLKSNNYNGFSSGEKMGFGVPQVHHNHYNNHDNTQIHQSMELLAFGGIKEQSKDYIANNMISRKWSEDKDGSFLVPQISYHSNVSKRLRTMW